MKFDAIIGLEITLQIGCPMRCLYCPQEVLLARYPKDDPKSFTLESFKHCLRTVPVSRHLTFMGASEPFVNKEAVEMMVWSHERGHELSISTTLRGATKEKIDAISNLRMTDVIIHVPADDGRMNLEPTDEWLDLFQYAISKWRHYPEFLISTFGNAHPKIYSIWLESGIEIHNFGYHNRAGLLSGRLPEGPVRDLPYSYGTHKLDGSLQICGKQFCGHLLPNGYVVRCCNDFGLECVWGNLNTDNYEDLFKTPKFKAYIKSLQDPNSDIPCRYCKDCYKEVNPEDRHKTYDRPY